MKRFAIYCASSSKIDPKFFTDTERLAVNLVKYNAEVVYGGGAVGLMGKLADTVLQNGGKVTGIMPNFMNSLEWAHPGLTNIEFVETMHERKYKMIENSDGIIALPGGTGTLEELLEAITWKRLGLYTKPIVILNTDNFYEPLRAMLERCISENFMNEKHRDMWQFVDNPDDVIDALENSAGWDSKAIGFAVVR